MKVFAKPAPGTIVPRPDGGSLAPEGELVEKSDWWLRRERDGDVTITANAPKPPKPPKKAPAGDPAE